jgi:hypothetical protein
MIELSLVVRLTAKQTAALGRVLVVILLMLV